MRDPQGKKKVLIVYLGRRGGGHAVLEELMLVFGVLREKVQCVVWKSRNNSANLNSRLLNTCEIKNFSIIHSGLSMLNPLQLLGGFFSIIQFRRELRKVRPEFVVQVMPSPFDYFVDYFAAKMGIPIVRLIHDFQVHPGESWPTEKAIRSRVSRAQIIVVFSRYVLNNLEKHFQSEISLKKFKLAQLPRTLRSDEVSTVNFFNNRSDNRDICIAFIGRALRYKGLEFLASALSETKFKFEFIAGGTGEFPKILMSDYKVINRWLSDSEFTTIIEQSDLIVLPYIEASQSGIIPLARQAGKWILATDVGGLKEQLDGYNRSVVVGAGSRDELVKGLQKVHSLWLLDDESSPSRDDDSSIPGIGKIIRELLAMEDLR